MIYTPSWVSRLQDALSIPVSWIKPLLSVQWGYGTKDKPDFGNVRLCVFVDTPSLYMNGIVFFGVQFPFFVNFMLRWSQTSFLQTHIGWRPIDGAPVIVFRIQTDESAQGGLVSGWEDGGK